MREHLHILLLRERAQLRRGLLKGEVNAPLPLGEQALPPLELVGGVRLT